MCSRRQTRSDAYPVMSTVLFGNGRSVPLCFCNSSFLHLREWSRWRHRTLAGSPSTYFQLYSEHTTNPPVCSSHLLSILSRLEPHKPPISCHRTTPARFSLLQSERTDEPMAHLCGPYDIRRACINVFREVLLLKMNAASCSRVSKLLADCGGW